MRNSFFRQVLVLASGSIGAQAITFVFSLALARIYDGEAFGYFSAFVGLLSILGILATGSYDKALMFARSKRRAASLVVLIFVMAASVAFLVCIGGILAFFLSLELPLGLSYGDVIVLLPLGVIFVVATQVAICLLMKEDRTKTVSMAKLMQASAVGVLQTSGGAIWSQKWIAVGYVAGLMGYIPAVYYAASRLLVGHWRGLRRAAIASAKRFRRYPLFVCPNELLDVVSHQVPLLLIGWLFSLATLGQYGFAQRILAGPAALIGQAVGQVFFKSVGHDQLSAHETKALIYRVWLFMAAIGIVPFAILFFWGEEIFGLVFGSAWGDAGKMAEILSILLFLRFVSSPTSTVYYKLNMQRAQLGFCFLGAVVRGAPVLLSFYAFDILQVIAIQVVGEMFVIVVFNGVALRKLGDV